MQRKRERRTIMLAVLASLLLHFAVAISLASFGDKLQPSLPEEEKPVELTLVDLAPTRTPPIAPKNAPFIDTPEKRETKEEPKEKTFESNANSKAASALPALGDAPIPTQDGKTLPGIDFEAQRHSLAMQGAQPQPQARPTPASPPPTATLTPAPSAAPTPQPTNTPVPTATPRPTLEPTPTPEPEQLAMLRATPPPSIPAPEEPTTSPSPAAFTPPPARPTPEAPSSSYRREQTPTRVTGNISNRGVSSVNAVGTPLGRYQKIVGDAIGSRWYALVDRHGDQINIGTVHVDFVVDRTGRIGKVRIIENTSSESFVNLCLQSVQDTKLPPIPEDVAGTLPPDGLPADMSFTIYANR
jgi:outer membrane biosynthesis protein TonB